MGWYVWRGVYGGVCMVWCVWCGLYDVVCMGLFVCHWVVCMIWYIWGGKYELVCTGGVSGVVYMGWYV